MRKISVKLIIGILVIVLTSTVLSALLYSTLYEKFVLEGKAKEMIRRGEQIGSFSVTLTDESVSKTKRLQTVKLVERLTDSIIWIADSEGNVILNTEESSIDTKLNINNAKIDKYIVTREFSNYFKQNTLSVGVPIIKDKDFKGVVFLHSPIGDAYKAYDQYRENVFKILLLTLILSLILGAIYSKFFTINIEKMRKAAVQISKGNYNARTKVLSNDEFGELAKTLDNMAADIDKKIKEIQKLEKVSKELVANVSHEFKTPLTLIRGYVENIEDGVIEPTEEVYKKIINNTKALEGMVNEILDLSKLESGNVELKKETFELDLLIGSIVKEMSMISEKKNIDILFEKNTEDSILINADYQKMRQVLVILIDNAIKYSKEMGKVQIRLDKNTIEIEDNGIGIEKDEIEHIFDRFYQVDKSSKKAGHGLGLCIAKTILDMHGYKVEVNSERNLGTKIKIIFK